jgi:selenocysteine lyase/cysteine desulfurase
VDWTNPWKEHRFVDNIEAREDGGTPGFLQAIKAALAIRLKEAMGVERILAREHELVPLMLNGLRAIPRVHVLADQLEDRLGIFSFYVEDLHYNLIVKLLDDRFGVQARGGCSCAGTYGHYLLHVDPTRSHAITDKIDHGDLSEKPGWVRLSIHPTTTTDEALEILDAVGQVVERGAEWGRDYEYSCHTNEFSHRSGRPNVAGVRSWFDLGRGDTATGLKRREA